MHWARHPPVDRILHTRLWRHYLSATTLRTVKIHSGQKSVKQYRQCMYDFHTTTMVSIASKGWTVVEIGIVSSLSFTRNACSLFICGRTTKVPSGAADLIWDSNLLTMKWKSAWPINSHQSWVSVRWFKIINDDTCSITLTNQWGVRNSYGYSQPIWP